MACFVVPATEAIVTTIATKLVEKKELSEGTSVEIKNKELLSSKLKRLNGLLWGGSALLAFEHFWHGEIQPFFPFLTAASNPEDAIEMLREMSTVGVTMAVLTTAVWAVTNVVVAYNLKNKDKKAEV